MKKNIIILASFVTFGLLLTGCGSTDSSNDGALEETSEIYVTFTEDAEVVMPAAFIGTEVSDENAVSVDENGAVTYSLSAEERGEVVNGIRSDFKASINSILADKTNYPDIVSITPNTDYTEFTIAVTDGQINMYESMLCMSFYTIGNKYQIYNGIDASDALTTVTFTNATTGDVVASADSSSLVTN